MAYYVTKGDGQRQSGHTPSASNCVVRGTIRYDTRGMIRYVTGDLLAADSEALVNSVNCVGGMGRGVALAFKRRFPDNFKGYKDACDRGELQPGRMLVFETGELMPRLIINFPTKRHWRARSRLADIEAGLWRW